MAAKPRSRSAAQKLSPSALAAVADGTLVLELDLDGQIVAANPQLLQTLGYTHDELVGKPHRTLVEPSFAESKVCRDLWQKLERGEAARGELLCITKLGGRIWLEARYAPLTGAKGKPSGFILAAADITAQKEQSLNHRAQVEAISRSMAVIEFALDGTVTDVNANFLNAFGYTREEVVDQHHRLFVEPSHAKSEEYATHWKRLRAGEYVSGEFLRLGKGGRPVWIQASYNPILDAAGKPFKIVKFAADITEQRRQQLDEEGRKRQLMEALRIKSALDGSTTPCMIADADFKIVYANEAFLRHFRGHEGAIQADLPAFRLDTLVGSSIDIFHKSPQRQRQMLANLRGHHRTQIKLGKRIFNLTAGVARDASTGVAAGYSLEWLDVTEEVKAQEEVARVLSAAVQGDLLQRIDAENFNGFLRNIGESTNKLLDSVAESFGTVKVAIDQIGQAAGQLRSTSQLMSSSSVQLNQAAEGSMSLLVRVADGVRANAENAAMANQLVTQTSSAAQGGQGRMEEMNTAMAAINGSAQQIAKIIKVIDEIAFQTNLLALNAAVEAARAGRHGKGFAVVAQEVRSLAERSAKAAKETAALIEDSVTKVAQGVTIADATRLALRDIVSNVVKVVDLVGEIAAASSEQSKSVGSVSNSVRQVTEGAQAGSQQSNEVASAAEELGRQTNVLKQGLDKYRVSTQSRTLPGLPAGTPAGLVEQVLAALKASGVYAPTGSPTETRGPALPQPAPVYAADPTSNGHGPNGYANGHGTNGHGTNGHGANGHTSIEPRALLPLDRDERGFNGF
jgi:methyl-accepting chemotaxis protein